jgi:hypothetical protein
VIITTKWGLSVKREPRQFIPNASREYLREVLEQSLARMGIDYIDVLILRSPDPRIPLADSMQYMKVQLPGSRAPSGCPWLAPRPLSDCGMRECAVREVHCVWLRTTVSCPWWVAGHLAPQIVIHKTVQYNEGTMCWVEASI